MTCKGIGGGGDGGRMRGKVWATTGRRLRRLVAGDCTEQEISREGGKVSYVKFKGKGGGWWGGVWSAWWVSSRLKGVAGGEARPAARERTEAARTMMGVLGEGRWGRPRWWPAAPLAAVATQSPARAYGERPG